MKLNNKVIEIIKKGRVYSKGKIKVWYLPNDDAETELFFSLSKKLFNAVNRNYIKRVIREILRKDPLPYKLLIKVDGKELDFDDFLNFFVSFREELLNEKNIHIFDKDLPKNN